MAPRGRAKSEIVEMDALAFFVAWNVYKMLLFQSESLK